MTKDPVCGMNVDEKKAISSVHQATTYYFCSANCKEIFQKDPSRYAKA